MSRSLPLRRLDPAAAAAQVASQGADDAWTLAFLDALEHRVRTAPLERVMTSWQLTAADAGRIFGVSRQAVAKWRAGGVPQERAVDLADLAAATDVLERYVRRDRIPAVVRRPAQMLGDRSLLQLAEAGEFAQVRAAAAAMLDLRRVAP